VDFEQLNGPQKKILRQAVLAAFTNETSLDIFLNDALSKPPLATFAGGANLEQMVFHMIADAQAQGWTGDLIGALQGSRPRNALVRNLADTLRLATTEAPPRPAAPGMTLEKIVSGGGFADLRVWAEKMSTIGQAICRIEYPTPKGTGYGTGILVSGNRVLTNYHVVEPHISKQLDPATIICRFDYARDTKGLDEGRPVTLAPGPEWIVENSPYDQADTTGVGNAKADCLDFALLRLSEDAGKHDVGSGVLRGHVRMRRPPPVPQEKAPVFIVQHPSGTPMALSIGIMQKHDNPVRLRYDADTLGGSSGSGVFNQQLDLVALHHAGDPTSKIRAQYNQGIPIGSILAMLDSKGVEPIGQ
jgi:Trypsin-like peptidase domain/Effector-associated domain 1